MLTLSIKKSKLVHFVLGKSSSKDMRAERAANLIFNGGKTKKIHPIKTYEEKYLPHLFKYLSDRFKVDENLEAKKQHVSIVQNAIDFINTNQAKKIVLSRREEVSCNAIEVFNVLKKMLNNYKNAFVAIACSVDAIVPSWAYLLMTTYLEPFAKKIVVGDLNLLESVIFSEVIANFANSKLGTNIKSVCT